MRPEVMTPVLSEVEKRLVDEAVVEKKLVEVALVEVEFPITTKLPFTVEEAAMRPPLKVSMEVVAFDGKR